MASSRSKALCDGPTLEQKKEMASMATDWQAGRRPEAADVSMGDAADDEPAPPSPVHCTMTIGEACSHFMDMVRDEREEKFRKAQANAGYNLQLLEEHRQAEQQLDDGRAIASDAGVVKHATPLFPSV